MVNTGEGQEDSRSLVRKQSVLFYTLRRFNKSQRRGGPGRSTGRDGGTSVWVSRDTGGPQGGPTPAGFPGPVILDDHGRVVEPNPHMNTYSQFWWLRFLCLISPP